MRTWGIHFIAYLPLPAQIALAGLALTVVMLVMAKAEWPNHAILGMEGRPWMIALFAGLLFLVFSAATALLGDGELWLNDVSAGADPNPTARAPLLLRFFGWIYPLLQNALGISAQAFFRFISALSGIATILAWLRLGRMNRVPVALVLLTGFAWGGIALFFGYVEMYPPLVAVVSWMLVLMLSSGRTGKPSEAVTAILLGIMALALNAMAVVLLPVLIDFIWQRFVRIPAQERIGALAGAIVLGLCGLAYFVFGWYRGNEFFLPLARIVSLRHGADLLNSLALAAGPAGIMWFWWSRRDQGAERMLVALALIFPLAALVVHNPQLGSARDWDIAAALLTAIPIAGILAWAELRKRLSVMRIATGLQAIWLLLVIVPWIAVQNSEPLAIERFRDLLRLEPEASASGWDYLMSFYKQQDDLDSWAECNREAVGVSPNPRYHANLAHYYTLKRNWPAAESEALQARASVMRDSVITDWERRVTNPTALLQAAAEYRRNQSVADAEHAERVAALLAPVSQRTN